MRRVTVPGAHTPFKAMRPVTFKSISEVKFAYNEPRKNLLLSIESWLFNRDPYDGLLKSLYKWVV